MSRLAMLALASSLLGAACGGAPAGGRASTLADARFAIAVDATDVGARRQLAALELAAGNRGAALAQLLAAERLGGPLGSRLDDTERATLATLLLERAATRVRRDDPAAADDVAAAAAHGAAIAPDLRIAAALLDAVAQLRHAADDVRAAGRVRLAALADDPALPADARAAARGAAATADPPAQAAFATWAWQHGARRAAAEVFAAMAAPTDDAVRAAALAWWRGERPARPATMPALAEALVDVLHGDAPGWSTAIVFRGAVDSDPGSLPIAARPSALRLRRNVALTEVALTTALAAAVDLVPSDPWRLVLAAEAAIAGRPAGQIDALLAGSTLELASRLRAAIGTGAVPAAPVDPDEAASRRCAGQVGLPALAAELADVARAFRVSGERAAARAEVLLARAIDQAAAHAALGALFDELGDSATARAHWQAAVDDAPRSGYQLGLAVAQAHGGDPDAALVHVTTAAAASGDPALTIVLAARALLDGDAPGQALEILRVALELAGPDVLPAAVDAAVAASEALGRPAQAAALRAEYPVSYLAVHTADLAVELATDDPTDASAAVRSGDVARLAVAARWHPADAAGVAARAAIIARTPADDPRHRVALAELQGLAARGELPLVADAARAALQRRGGGRTPRAR